MLEEYDFSKAVRNPYVSNQPEQVTIQVSAETAEYFRTLSQQTGVPYQTLMKLYLKDCAEQKRRLTFA
jgi:predicted DNA binding CopG/RHH family protein